MNVNHRTLNLSACYLLHSSRNRFRLSEIIKVINIRTQLVLSQPVTARITRSPASSSRQRGRRLPMQRLKAGIHVVRVIFKKLIKAIQIKHLIIDYGKERGFFNNGGTVY